MEDYIGTMGFIKSFDNIRAANIEETIAYSSSGTLVRCTNQNESTLELLTWNGIKFTTEMKDYNPLGTPTFYAGDEVYDPIKDRSGTIRYVFFHFNRGEFYYQVDFEGKKSNKWFFDNDLGKL